MACSHASEKEKMIQIFLVRPFDALPAPSSSFGDGGGSGVKNYRKVSAGGGGVRNFNFGGEGLYCWGGGGGGGVIFWSEVAEFLTKIYNCIIPV